MVNNRGDCFLALVSVVIPIYNAGEMLHECVESVLAQEYGNIEILLVDDGSTDSSGELCDELAMNNQSIIAIHQSNMGPSAARNAGVRMASGEYITFVDSDDYVHPCYVCELVAMLEGADADISICGLERFSDAVDIRGKARSKPGNSFELFSWQEYMDVLLKVDGNRTVCYPCGKLFRTSLFTGRDVFPDGISHGEDVLATYLLVRSALTVVESSSCLYFYRNNPESITGGAFNEGYFQLYEVWMRISSLAQTEDAKLRKGVEFNNDRVDFTLLCDMLLKGSRQTDSLYAEERRIALVGLRRHYGRLLFSPLPANRKVIMTVLVVFGDAVFQFVRMLQSSSSYQQFWNSGFVANR